MEKYYYCTSKTYFKTTQVLKSIIEIFEELGKLKIKHRNWDMKLYIQHDSNFVIQLCIFLKKILRGFSPKLVGFFVVFVFFLLFHSTLFLITNLLVRLKKYTRVS